jgi:hypothetical protein
MRAILEALSYPISGLSAVTSMRESFTNSEIRFSLSFVPSTEYSLNVDPSHGIGLVSCFRGADSDREILYSVLSWSLVVDMSCSSLRVSSVATSKGQPGSKELSLAAIESSNAVRLCNRCANLSESANEYKLLVVRLFVGLDANIRPALVSGRGFRRNHVSAVEMPTATSHRSVWRGDNRQLMGLQFSPRETVAKLCQDGTLRLSVHLFSSPSVLD